MHSVEDIDATDQSTGAGVAAATPSGKRPGRRPRLTESDQEEVVRLYREATTSTAEIRDRFGIGDSSLYRLLQKHGVPLRGRAPTASSAVATSAPASTPASSASTSSSNSSSRGRRPSRTRTAPPRTVKAPTPAMTTAPSGNGTSATARTSKNGAGRAFSVSFRLVRIVEADSVLDVVREVERLGATDIEEISRQ
jgi:transposase-like protein